MSTPLPIRHPIGPVRYRRHPPQINGYETDIASLCAQAQIPLRATVPGRRILIYPGEAQIRTPDVDVVGVPVLDLSSQEAALRALEALAFAFFDHAARTCVCKRGLFTGAFGYVQELPQD